MLAALSFLLPESAEGLVVISLYDISLAMRILADLSEDDVKWLDARATELGISRASLLREAVAAFRAAESTQGLELFLGLWARQGSGIDGLVYEQLLRGEATNRRATRA